MLCAYSIGAPIGAGLISREKHYHLLLSVEPFSPYFMLSSPTKRLSKDFAVGALVNEISVKICLGSKMTTKSLMQLI